MSLASASASGAAFLLSYVCDWNAESSPDCCADNANMVRAHTKLVDPVIPCIFTCNALEAAEGPSVILDRSNTRSC